MKDFEDLNRKPIFINYFLSLEQQYPLQTADVYDLLASNNNILDAALLIKIMEAEGIEFEPDSLRIRTESQGNIVFAHLPLDFSFELDPEAEEPLCLLLKQIKKPTLQPMPLYEGKLNTILESIEGLKGVISNIYEAGPESNLPRINSLVRSTSLKSVFVDPENMGFMQSTEFERIDLLILFSNPLVTKTKVALCDPVDFEGEIVQLKRILKNLGKQIVIKVDVATKANLRNYLSPPPRIIHFICHGGFSQKKQQFYLAFENEKLEQEECDTKQLRELIEEVEKPKGKLELVFVNACHSEEVGKVFIDSGVENVIAVQSDLQIRDSVAQVFSELFYERLFSGMGIKHSFDYAMTNVKNRCEKKDIFSCCCAHKHDPNCEWWESRQNNENQRYAHERHLPTCMCPRAKEHIHKKCKWANKFEIDFPGISQDEKLLEEMNSKRNLGKDEIFVCCCHPELPHDETQKFL